MPKDEVKYARVFIGLGSNIEPRIDHLREAVRAIGELGEIVRKSEIYETSPVGVIEQPDFFNAVMELQTQIEPLDLVHQLKSIERRIGRIERPRWHEREIDLDILFYNDLFLETTELTIPHPELHKRAFVLVPMAEIAPTFVHPVLCKAISEILNDVESSGVHKTELFL